MLSLIKPTVEYEQSYRSYIQELGDSERYPFTLDFEYDDFPALVTQLKNCSLGIGLPDGWVPHTTFWLVEHEEIVGVSSLRHHMTDRLKRLGGHIGFGVRPSAQGRGIGKELLRQTLIEARRLGIPEVLMICLKDNVASSRVILANGGTLESEYSAPEYSGLLQRYVISIDADPDQRTDA
ncbi:MAG: GNAT family N-acetyltransferase [Woeseiaceae bacterium]|nr:GNAT family N-acetyltransferase [Woeseiaceae bacterium]